MNNISSGPTFKEMMDLRTDRRDRRLRLQKLASAPDGIQEAMPVGSLWRAKRDWGRNATQGFHMVVSHGKIKENENQSYYGVDMLQPNEQVQTYWYSDKDLENRFWDGYFDKAK